MSERTGILERIRSVGLDLRVQGLFVVASSIPFEQARFGSVKRIAWGKQHGQDKRPECFRG